MEAYQQLQKRDDPASKKFVERMSRSPHLQRVLAYCSAATEELPWEGIRWVLQLLPDRPTIALAALDAYFLAHMWDMFDMLIAAMSDAEAVIRARYIGVPETQEERRQTLYDLSPVGAENRVTAPDQRLRCPAAVVTARRPPSRIARRGPSTRVPDAHPRAELAGAARPIRRNQGRRDPGAPTRGRRPTPTQHSRP